MSASLFVFKSSQERDRLLQADPSEAFGGNKPSYLAPVPNPSPSEPAPTLGAIGGRQETCQIARRPSGDPPAPPPTLSGLPPRAHRAPGNAPEVHRRPRPPQKSSRDVLRTPQGHGEEDRAGEEGQGAQPGEGKGERRNGQRGLRAEVGRSGATLKS